MCMYDFTIEELMKLIVPQNNETEWKKEKDDKKSRRRNKKKAQSWVDLMEMKSWERGEGRAIGMDWRRENTTNNG